MNYKIEITDKPGIFDAAGHSVERDVLDLGIDTVKEVRFAQVYTLCGTLNFQQAQSIAEDLLVDRIAQDYTIVSPESTELPLHPSPLTLQPFVIEVAYNPGVMDPSEQSILKGIADLGIDGVESVRAAKKYLIKGKLSPAQLKTISEKLLYNKLIQHIVSGSESETRSPEQSGYEFSPVTVDLLSAPDKKLQKISSDGQLFLNLAEMRQIKNNFKKLKRNPTDCELETIAQTWSEHCWHKTFRGKIDYKETVSRGQKAVGAKKI